MHGDDAAVTFDCFGTLVDVDPPGDVAGAIADALTARGVDVPADWAEVYPEPHIDLEQGAELPLHEHVQAVLAERERSVDLATAEAAVLAAFDREVRTREGAADAVAAAADHGPVGVLSNCTVPGLVERTLSDAAVETDHLDAVVTSVGCGWRKPDERAFRAAADALDVDPAGLLHVGDDPEADGGVEALGGEFWPVPDRPLTEFATELEGEPCP